MKLTRKQELYLINRGMISLLDEVIKPIRPKTKPKIKTKKWTRMQRAKFAATMKKKWQKTAHK